MIFSYTIITDEGVDWTLYTGKERKLAIGSSPDLRTARIDLAEAKEMAINKIEIREAKKARAAANKKRKRMKELGES